MLPIESKQQLIERINNAQTKERLEEVVALIPLQPNGHRYQVANVLEDLFWYIDFPALTLDYCKDWMLKRVVAYA